MLKNIFPGVQYFEIYFVFQSGVQSLKIFMLTSRNLDNGVFMF